MKSFGGLSNRLVLYYNKVILFIFLNNYSYGYNYIYKFNFMKCQKMFFEIPLLFVFPYFHTSILPESSM